ncbi:MAG: cytochrome c oxidase subunit II [Actinomycetes bacterium]
MSEQFEQGRSGASRVLARPRRYHRGAVRPASSTLKKFALLALSAAALASLAMPSFASALAFEPQSGGSPNADAIVELYRIIAVFGIIIFLGVEAALIWSLVKYRKSKGAVASGPSENGKLEVLWTAAAAGVVVILAAVTFIKLPAITDPPNGAAPGVMMKASRSAALVPEPTPPNGKKITIDVTGRQYIWRYTYGETMAAPFAYTEMVAPSDTVVVLRIQATDVIHSWWIPKLGGKFDAVPGSTNYTWFKAPAPKSPAGDVYTGQCAELCGSQHASMLARVRVVTPAQFAVWLSNQKQRIAQANKDAVKERAKLTSEGQVPNLTPPPN